MCDFVRVNERFNNHVVPIADISKSHVITYTKNFIYQFTRRSVVTTTVWTAERSLPWKEQMTSWMATFGREVIQFTNVIKWPRN